MMRAARALGLVAGLAGPAAADYTHDRVIGFSEDGRYFAFETYGLQRGSGLPYSNIFVVDLDRDAWVPGSPIRVGASEADMAEVEAAPYAALAATRAEARSEGADLIEALEIRRPATVLFARGIGEAHDAPSRITVSRPDPDDPTRSPQAATTLELEAIAVPGGAEFCPDPDALRGYRLTRRPQGQAPRILHEDSRIPDSRRCPVAYRLDAVLSPGHPKPDGRGAALISVWGQGFEGLERRVIAVPVPLPGPAAASMAPEGDTVSGVAASFVEGFAPRDIRRLEEALRETLPGDPASVFLPDADLSPATRAVMLVDLEEASLRHYRSWITVETREVRPAGAGGPVPVSLVSVERYNLGPARRARLVESTGSDRVAPPEAFGTGPDVAWRIATRPVQGMRADLVAAGRGVIERSGQATCGPVPCAAADPARIDGTGTAPPGGMAPGDAMPARADGLPSDADLVRRLEAAGPAETVLIERGLWQDHAVQAVSFVDGAPVRGIIATPDTVNWLRSPRVEPAGAAPDGD